MASSVFPEKRQRATVALAGYVLRANTEEESSSHADKESSSINGSMKISRAKEEQVLHSGILV